jgi:hypothetical protein
MDTLDIESGVPIPEVGVVQKYPLRDMEPGDSIFFPKDQEKIAASARSCAWRFSKMQDPPWVFTLRRTDPLKDKDGFRLWRIK